MSPEKSASGSPDAGFRELAQTVADLNRKDRAKNKPLTPPLAAYLLGRLSRELRPAYDHVEATGEPSAFYSFVATLDQTGRAIEALKEAMAPSSRIELIDALKVLRNHTLDFSEDRGARGRPARGPSLVIPEALWPRLSQLADRALDGTNPVRPWYDLGVTVGLAAQPPDEPGPDDASTWASESPTNRRHVGAEKAGSRDDRRAGSLQSNHYQEYARGGRQSGALPDLDPASPIIIIARVLSRIPDTSIERIPLLRSLKELIPLLERRGPAVLFEQLVMESQSERGWTLDPADPVANLLVLRAIDGQICHALSSLDGPEASSLEVPRRIPHWKEGTQELLLDGKPIRSFRKQASVAMPVLVAFQSQNWPHTIDTNSVDFPEGPKDPQALSAVIHKTINKGLGKIRFFVEKGGKKIGWTWLPDA